MDDKDSDSEDFCEIIVVTPEIEERRTRYQSLLSDRDLMEKVLGRLETVVCDHSLNHEKKQPVCDFCTVSAIAHTPIISGRPGKYSISRYTYYCRSHLAEKICDDLCY